MDDSSFGVPAGWYPDPLGLPQLRWWDAQAWTEHTSEARAPIVIQPAARVVEEEVPVRDTSYNAATRERGYTDETRETEYSETRGTTYGGERRDTTYGGDRREAGTGGGRFSYTTYGGDRRDTQYGEDPRGEADWLRRLEEEGPSRREQRDRERRESALPFETIAFPDVYPEFETLSDPAREEVAPQPLLAMTLKEIEPTLFEPVGATVLNPLSASAHTNAAPAASTLSALLEEEAPARAPKQLKTYTGAAWAMALMPAIQLTVAVLMITVFNLGNNFPLMMMVLFAPYAIVLFFAAFDRLILQTWGHKHPANNWWSLLTEVGYLVPRAMRTYRETGKGFATLGVLGAAGVSVIAGILVLPGLLIAVFPGVFAKEVANSVEGDALVLGAEISVACPAPPLLIGDVFTCIRSTESGDTDSLAVRLERENGWISWRVIDWGTSIMVTQTPGG